MHLKRVELENFKSFGRALTVPFLKGFTAITGPNGSGKSNIGDAILFVLGPRSSKLIRAGRLTDLIFNGGATKKAAQHLKVSLVFDNTDRVIPLEQDEVTLTRFVKRSKNEQGYNSYFYVNGKPSSQGEFERLLSQARISADGYNIVRQGDILDLMNGSALDHRRKLDEVAGVTRFDADIDTAEKRKLDVEANLDRLGILLGEIKATLKTLERQREQAMKYKDLKHEADVVRAKLAHKRKASVEEEIAGASRRLEMYREERQNLEAKEEELKAALAEAEARLTDLEERLAEAGGDEAKELAEKVQGLRTAIATESQKAAYFSKEELPALKKEAAERERDLARQEKTLDKLAKDREKLEAELKKVRTKVQAKEAELEEVKAQISASSDEGHGIQRDIAKLREAFDAKTDELGRVRVDEDRARERLERARVDVARLEEAVESTELEVKSVRFELRELTKESKDAKGSLESLQKEHFKLKKQEAELSKELNELGEAIRRHQNEFHRLKAEQDAAAMARQGFTRAVGAILDARDTVKLRGIAGTIAELGKVDAKYETALEVAAGGRMQAVVTENDEDAANAIQFLKKNRLGRATFLPLNRMSGSRPAGKSLLTVRQAGAIGFAVDLVRFDEKYKAAFSYVFRDTVVVEDLDAARRLMGGVRLVTLDGDVVDAGGAMTGGLSARETSGPKFGQQAAKDMEEAAKKLRSAMTYQEGLVKDLGEVRDRIQGLETQIGDARNADGSAGSRVTELELKAKEYETRVEAAKAEKAAREKELTAAEKELGRLTEKAEGIEAALAELTERRDTLGKRLLAATDKDLADRLEAARTGLAALQQEATSIEAQIQVKENELRLVEERRDELSAALEGSRHEIAARESEVEGLTANAEGLRQELDVLEATQHELLAQNQALLKEKDAAYRATVDLGAKLAKVRDDAATKDDMILKCEMDIPRFEDQLREAEAEIAALVVTVELPVHEPLDELKASMRDLDQRLSRIGDVNMTAIEEYDTQDARRKELEEKREHLDAQRTELVNLVEEITEKKTAALMEVYVEVRKNFQDVYAELSGGGAADLLLENEKRPFDGGLIVKAQPPGKKVVRLASLSGGEMSLCALAFIFAMQRYDPSPFYVLDEVDQNLDAVNAELVAAMIHNNSAQAQVLLVSHKKVTLRQAHHVYGVTMNKSQGISEVIGEVSLDNLPTVTGDGADAPSPGDGGEGEVVVSR